MVRKPKLLSSIRAKLFSAVAMLLVAVIMVVSSTYAWFTLSTAPEVTGMTTAIGANGALEMALRYSTMDEAGGVTHHDVQNGVVTEPDNPLVSNTYWGNMVDVSNDAYGLQSIILYPSALNGYNATDENSNVMTHIYENAFLMTPTYGADGRVSELEANTLVGTYGDNGFVENDLLGVRGVGTSSGLSDRQIAYRSAAAAAATALSQAKTITAQSLTTHGNSLSTLAVSLAMNDSYACTVEDVEKIEAIMNELQRAVDKLDEAYSQTFLAFVASAAGPAGEDETAAWQQVKTAIGNGAESAEIVALLNTLSITNIPADIAQGYAAYNGDGAMVDDLAAAFTSLDAAKADPTAAKVKAALSCIVNPSQLKVNGMLVSEFKDAVMEDASIAMGGINVSMQPGSGLYADMAQQCGNFKSEVTISELSYGTLSAKNLPATMKTEATDPFAPKIASALTNAGQPAAAASGAQSMTEIYGYILDLAFRTNAATSNLLLQAEPSDRIYDGNGNELTQGSGSVMEFAPTTQDLDADQIKGLMGAIRIVFFKTDLDADAGAYEIIKTAKLDATNATVVDGTYKATVVLDDGTDVIMALTQNETHNISVLVYLDGTNIENGDVAASVSTSLNGKLNLQFASSATLVPMENGDLLIPDASEGETESESTATQNP